ncbi:hypothetical protein [Pseudomonas putida]|uniref:Uncharacterized protein n=1 Tax=Pseudomonas putida TaxID=303 RepID=A0A8I1JI29_PSEPU|nr:hypothetical protein [Pseudomonas putida]MBI6883281.1 hypothetical protein [Pseudomonas putida]
MKKVDQNLIASLVEHLERRNEIGDSVLFNVLIEQHGRQVFIEHLSAALSKCSSPKIMWLRQYETVMVSIANHLGGDSDEISKLIKESRRPEDYILDGLSNEDFFDFISSAKVSHGVEFRRRLKGKSSNEFIEDFKLRLKSKPSTWFLNDCSYGNQFIVQDLITSVDGAPGVKYLFNNSIIKNHKLSPSSVHELLAAHMFRVESILQEKGSILTPLISMLSNCVNSGGLSVMKSEGVNIYNYCAQLSKHSYRFSIADADLDEAKHRFNDLIVRILTLVPKQIENHRRYSYSSTNFDVIHVLKRIMYSLSIFNDSKLSHSLSHNDGFVEMLFNTMSSYDPRVAIAVSELVEMKAIEEEDLLSLADTEWKCRIVESLVPRNLIMGSSNRLARSVVLENDLGM